MLRILNRRPRWCNLKVVLLSTVLSATAVLIIYGTGQKKMYDMTDKQTQSHHQIVCKSSNGIPVKSISNSTTAAGVPMILHFVYKNTSILESYRSGLETCVRLNSNWKVMLWTDDSMKSFITREYPQHQKVFYLFPQKIQRADAIRYLILYRFGGVYMDLDMICRQPLLTSLSNIPCFLDRERLHQTMVLHGKEYSAMNSAMGCRPGHPFFKKLIDQVFHEDRLKGEFRFPKTILDTTGPGILTKHYQEWSSTGSQPSVTLLSESYFSPNVNPRSGLYQTCRDMVKSMPKNKPNPTIRESACLAVHKLGYEQSDAAFITNQTVAIHQFTHLGYTDQHSKGFDALKLFPSILTYNNICLPTK